MLVDVEFAMRERLQEAKTFFAAHYGEKGFPENQSQVEATFGFETVTPGVYLASLNANHAISDFADRDVQYLDPSWTSKTTHGIADNPDQVVSFLEMQPLGREHVVFVTPIFKNGEPGSDGWRWEKWGRYIGTQNPQADYLVDEPDIDHIFVWEAVPIDMIKYEARMSSDLSKSAPAASTPRP